MPLLRQRQQIAIKPEAAAGTAEALALADVVQHVGVAEWEPDVAVTPRDVMSGPLSHRGSVIGSQAAKIRFSMHVGGTTGAPVALTNEGQFAKPFKACGAAVTVSGAPVNEQASYKPSSTTISDETTWPYSTIGLYEDGKLYRIHGAVGNCVLTFAVGQPVLAEFEFTGVYTTPTDVALLVPSYSAIVGPPFLGATMTVLAYATARVSTLTLDLGNEIAMRPNPNSTVGWLSAQITRRKPVGTLDPEEVLAAGKNWFSEWIAGTTGSITTGVFPSNGTNYNQLQLTIPKAQYMRASRADRDGVSTTPLEFECWANTDAGDDEWELITT
jgi:hypothetical protein